MAGLKLLFCVLTVAFCTAHPHGHTDGQSNRQVQIVRNNPGANGLRQGIDNKCFRLVRNTFFLTQLLGYPCNRRIHGVPIIRAYQGPQGPLCESYFRVPYVRYFRVQSCCPGWTVDKWGHCSIAADQANIQKIAMPTQTPMQVNMARQIALTSNQPMGMWQPTQNMMLAQQPEMESQLGNMRSPMQPRPFPFSPVYLLMSRLNYMRRVAALRNRNAFTRPRERPIFLVRSSISSPIMDMVRRRIALLRSNPMAMSAAMSRINLLQNQIRPDTTSINQGMGHHMSLMHGNDQQQHKPEETMKGRINLLPTPQIPAHFPTHDQNKPFPEIPARQPQLEVPSVPPMMPRESFPFPQFPVRNPFHPMHHMQQPGPFFLNRPRPSLGSLGTSPFGLIKKPSPFSNPETQMVQKASMSSQSAESEAAPVSVLEMNVDTNEAPKIMLDNFSSGEAETTPRSCMEVLSSTMKKCMASAKIDLPDIMTPFDTFGEETLSTLCSQRETINSCILDGMKECQDGPEAFHARDMMTKTTDTFVNMCNIEEVTVTTQDGEPPSQTQSETTVAGTENVKQAPQTVDSKTAMAALDVLKESKTTGEAVAEIKAAEQEISDSVHQAIKQEVKVEEVKMKNFYFPILIGSGIGFLVLVFVFSLFICCCCKRRLKHKMKLSKEPTKPSAIDCIYTIGVPPPVYEVKGIPHMSYEEAKGEKISAKNASEYLSDKEEKEGDNTQM